MTKFVYMQEENHIFMTANPEYHKQAKKLTNKEGKQLYREQAISYLRKRLTGGETVYTCVKHVSSSGMTRHISVFIVVNGNIQDISGYVAIALDWKRNDSTGGVVVSGCGMDMGFHLVYTLDRVLFPNGTEKPHGTRNGVPDSDGGYALKQSWI